ncbi:MAG: hypothetical protein LZF84_10625 [Nitrosomonas sp.]|nr:hypothetical protein [Nitrosomonas sp.]UJP07466.1 MAG: hypothetical protein LZF84_10625 [Nitrosomonas sp.]
MNQHIQNRARQILIHGLALVLVGIVWGLMIPHTPFPRLALSAHIQAVLNGMLFILMAVLLLTLPHRVSARSALVMLIAVCLTWLTVISEVANAWWGTAESLSIAAQQAGTSGGAVWQEQFVKLTHIPAIIGLIVAWILLIAGFVKKPDSQD